jgi:hypothetical protein
MPRYDSDKITDDVETTDLFYMFDNYHKISSLKKDKQKRINEYKKRFKFQLQDHNKPIQVGEEPDLWIPEQGDTSDFILHLNDTYKSSADSSQMLKEGIQSAEIFKNRYNTKSDMNRNDTTSALGSFLKKRGIPVNNVQSLQDLKKMPMKMRQNLLKSMGFL